MPELQKLNLKIPTIPTIPTATEVVKPVVAAVTTAAQAAPPEPHPKFPLFKIILPVAMILLGVGTGFAVANFFATGSLVPSSISPEIPTSGVKVGDVIGVPDAQTFKDSAEGVLEKGGLNGEGSHSLLRPNGPSQTVYLTSSVIDLDELVGDKIKVWGETFKGQKVGWLMDVGRVQVLELDAPKPQ